MRLIDYAWVLLGTVMLFIVDLKHTLVRNYEYLTGISGSYLLKQEIIIILDKHHIGFSKTELENELKKQKHFYLLVKDDFTKALTELVDEGEVAVRVRSLSNTPGGYFDNILRQHIPEIIEYLLVDKNTK